MKVIYLILFVLIVLCLMPMNSGYKYTYPDVGNEPGMKFWDPRVFFGPTENLARI